MEGTRGALLRLAAVCCLLCALPGEGENTTETSVTTPFLSTTPTSHQLRETSDLSPDTTAVPETSLGKNVTAATLNVTGVTNAEAEDASISATTVAGTEGERLQASATASPTDIPVTQHEHHNVSSSDNSSTEIPSPALTASTLEENQPDREVTEPFSTTEEMDDASSTTPTTPLNSVLATTNSSQLGPSDRQTVGPTEARSETRPGTSPVGATEVSTMEPRTSSAPVSTVGSTSSATASGTVTARPPVSSSATSIAASPTSTSPPEHPLEPMHEKASVLDVGDDENPELPSSPLADTTRADPLVIAVISVFIVMVGILGLVGFLRYRQHNSRMEFRRLQDLPMDDMMEDTPLSLYSY
ncbi:mucin-5AC-like [Cygnus atratus]|uniref:mucin-5AC-like n=1 Tax=Cygnus atratus TaxID=8868 RepID=UPI0015D630B7|nr:mucin-5AC-like [Cygnus atratus]